MHHRHDISDNLWNFLEPHLPGGDGSVGRKAEDNRRFINAVFWIFRTGAPWRDLPPDYAELKLNPESGRPTLTANPDLMLFIFMS
jgi:transposase